MKKVTCSHCAGVFYLMNATREAICPHCGKAPSDKKKKDLGISKTKVGAKDKIEL